MSATRGRTSNAIRGGSRSNSLSSPPILRRRYSGIDGNPHAGRPLIRPVSACLRKNDRSGPIYIIHNTADAVTPDPFGLKISSGSSPGWALIYARNNIWSSTSYALENENISYPVDLDYDNLWTGNNNDLVRWNNINYAPLAAFTAATGQEPNGLNVNAGFASPQNGGYMLNSMSSLIDAGVIIPGINHDYLGLAPDIGAFESRGVYLPIVCKH